MTSGNSYSLYGLHNQNYSEICSAKKISLLEVINITILAAIVMFGLIGNLLVVILVYKNKLMRKNINILISNLAVSDSLVLVDDLLSAMMESFAITPEYGRLACKVLYFVYDLGPVVSLLTLLIISISRYRAVSKPMKIVPLTTKMLALLIIGTWTVPLVFYAYDVMMLTRSKGHKIMACDFIESPFNFHFYIIQATFPLLIFLPILIINALILRKLRQAGTKVNLPPLQRKTRGLRIRSAVRMVLCSLLLYIILWMPLNIVYTLSSISLEIFAALQSNCFETIRSIAAIFITLHATNSALSPIVYVVFLEDFRCAIKKLFRSRSTGSTDVQMNEIHTQNLRSK